MSFGPDSKLVNGQLLAFPVAADYQPISYGPQTTGVPNVSPSYPPYMAATGSPMGTAPGAVHVGGYGTADNNSAATQAAASSPWSLRKSPTLWAIGGLVISLVLLKTVHWRDTVLEGANEGIHLGPLHESAAEAA